MIVVMVRGGSWTDWGPYAAVVGAHTHLGKLLAIVKPNEAVAQIWIFETMGM